MKQQNTDTGKTTTPEKEEDTTVKTTGAEVDKNPIREMPEKQKDKEIIGRCFEIVEEASDDTISIKTGDGYIIHYYIEMLQDKTVVLEMVGENAEPTGKLIEQISLDNFSKRFTTCSHHRCQLHPRTVEEISTKMAENRVIMGEEHLKKGELAEAEDKFNRALQFDEKSVKASLGLGKAKLEQDKIEEAMEIFKKLNKENEIYEQANKHTLNEFGIYMRGKKLYELAIDNYEKSISIDPKDEILFFNLGRAYGVEGSAMEDPRKGIKNIQKAIGIIREALGLDEDFPEAKNYLKELLKTEQMMLNNLLESDKTKPSADEVIPAVNTAVVADETADTDTADEGEEKKEDNADSTK